MNSIAMKKQKPLLIYKKCGIAVIKQKLIEADSNIIRFKNLQYLTSCGGWESKKDFSSSHTKCNHRCKLGLVQEKHQLSLSRSY